MTGHEMAPDDRGDTTSHEEGGAHFAPVDSLEALGAPFFEVRIVADRHYRQGVELEGRGQWERALRSFRTACDMHPQRVLYLLARGRICQAHGLENEAAACYSLARKVDPTDPVALFNEADLLARRGNLDAAVSNLRLLLDDQGGSHRPQTATAWRLLGDLELARRHAGAASDAYRRGAEIMPEDPYLGVAARAGDRLHDVAATDETAPLTAAGGVTMPAKAATYAFAGAMLLGLPDDDGIDVPTYPSLGFISIEEVAEALARPLALFRRRRVPFAAVHAVEPSAAPVAQALASALGVPMAVDPCGPRLSVSLDGALPSSFARECADPGDWAFSLGLRRAAWHYERTLDGALVAAAVEVPWASRDSRARPPDGDAAEALTRALGHVAGCDTLISRHLAWHRSRPHLRAGNPSATYTP